MPIFSIAIVLAVLGSIALQARAQVSSAAITGHVIDQSQGAVPNADVTLVEVHTNVTVSTRTNGNGDFIFTNEEPGTYTIVVTAPGYKELRKVNLVLSASQNLSAGSFTLPVGSQTQEVTVEADITPLQTTSSERSGVIDTEQMDNLLAIGRDAMAMTRTIPGVVGSEGSTSMSQSSTPTVNGVNTEYNMATVDGVTGNTRGFGTLDTPINLDAIQEVTVTESNYQAQYGKTAGAEINFVTKNGTQRFHGGVYEYFRNEDLNANSYFDKFGTNIARPRYRYNTLGGTIGGPVYWPGRFNHNKDRLFFFVSIEDSPIKTPDGLKYYTVPTLMQTQGDFSQTYNQGTSTQTPATLINIRNPNVAGACAVNSATPGPACFANNQISPSLLNGQGQILLQTIYNNTLKLNPSFAFTDLAVSNNNYNYVTNYSASKPVNQELFRIDYAPTERLHTFFRGEMTTVNDTDYSSPANDLPWLMPVNYKNSQPNFAYNLTYTFTPTLVNELNIGTAGWSENQLYAASDLAKAQLSSGGFNLPSLYSGVNPMNLYPAVSFGGVTDAATYAWDYRFPMVDQVRSYDAVDNVTKVLGNHTLKFGFEFERDHYLQYAHNRA
ncbi:MAG: TonB-dependent receptor, partial [Terracidiphilus sp.]